MLRRRGLVGARRRGEQRGAGAMNFRAARKGRRRVEATLELTPLIDVIFLLLIFFVMTTAPQSSPLERIGVDLPEAASGAALDEAEAERVVLRVAADGAVFEEREDGERVSVEAPLAFLQEVHGERPAATVWLFGDEEAAHGAVIRLLDAAREVGFKKVHMAVRPAQ
ncbi:biopolymer transporter ExbD [Lujinxingia vulgaris]|uniref:Biopolymer transporter ExbD n=2 Tax=Lujinxingia vulgaris TaxID=2600176 RepID=A0A5C6X5K0_9DELT|nr:biopolymer transporter ExbD [Lujinxingia vulgaris]